MFSACRKEGEEVKPKTEAETIQKAKEWFANKKAFAPILKSGENPLTEADREPDWNNTDLQTHLTAPLLEMPLKYDNKYLINSYRNPETGIRKTGITKLLLRQENDSIFKPIIMRIYGDSAYLAQAGNQFEENSFTQIASDFSGEVLYYDWQENFLGANRYANGQITNSIKSSLDKSSVYCITTTTRFWRNDDSGAAEAPGVTTGESWVTTTETVCYVSLAGSGIYGTGTGGNPSGDPWNSCCGGGGSGSGGGYDPYNGGIPTQGDNPKFSQAFNKIVDWSKTDSTNVDVKEIDKEVDRLYKESCLFKCMLDQLANAQPDGKNTPLFKMGFKVIPNLGESKYQPYTQTVNIDYEVVGGRAFSAIINEEMLHAYQDVFDRTYSRNIPPNGTGVPNVEVDAKLIIDIDNYRKEITTGSRLHQKTFLTNRGRLNSSYEKYLKTITNNGTISPNSSAALNTVDFTYAQVLQMFKTAYKDTPYDKPIDNNKMPTALLRLVQTCNCN